MIVRGGEWVESCLGVVTKIKKRWFGMGYKVYNLACYEIVWNGTHHLSYESRLAYDVELTIKCKTLKEAEEIKNIRDNGNRTHPYKDC